MRRRSLLFLLAAALLLSSGCGGGREQEKAEYVLYFLAGDGSVHGSALATEPYDMDGYTALHPENSGPDPGDLVAALLSGPTQEGLASPFPRGVTLKSWEWDPEQPGNVRISLSEQYSGLTDISLTLADYCIVLTLSQLEEVESVEIAAEGHTANYRSHQLLLPEEAVLTDQAAGGKASES